MQSEKTELPQQIKKKVNISTLKPVILLLATYVTDTQCISHSAPLRFSTRKTMNQVTRPPQYQHIRATTIKQRQ